MNKKSDTFREYEPEINSDIENHEYITCFIDLIEFDELVIRDNTNILIQFFEKLTGEIYHTRTKNYAWGYRMIEPRFIATGSSLILYSRLYKEKQLHDLNSMIVKLFIEYCNIITACALSLELPVCGGISIGELYTGKSNSHHPELMAMENPMVMADLLKIYSLSEIFPEGMHETIIPAYNLPFFFGKALSLAKKTSLEIDSVGIFMPAEFEKDVSTEISILSDMLLEVKLNGQTFYASNWISWVKMNENEFSMDDILMSARKNESEARDKRWQNFFNYMEPFL